MIRLVAPALSYPPGKNRAYTLTRDRRTDKGGLALSDEAREWFRSAVIQIRKARTVSGVRLDREARYIETVICHLWSLKMDVDAPLALALDAIQAAFDLNDTHVVAAIPIKRLVDDAKERRLDLYITLEPVASDAEFNARSDALLAEFGGVLGWTSR